MLDHLEKSEIIKEPVAESKDKEVITKKDESKDTVVTPEEPTEIETKNLKNDVPSWKNKDFNTRAEFEVELNSLDYITNENISGKFALAFLTEHHCGKLPIRKNKTEVTKLH